MLILFVLQIIFALSYLFVFNHYVFMPVPNLISAPSLVASPYTKPAYLYNAAIYALFFVQHIVMALLIFKIKVSKIWAKFPLY